MPETVIIKTEEIKNLIQPVSNPKCNRIIIFYGYVAFSVGKKCKMSFCRMKMIDITLKTTQKKQDSCCYRSHFVAFNHEFFPMIPCVAFTLRFNGYIFTP